MLPASVLGRLASRAVVVFAPPSAAATTLALSSGAPDFSQLVSCTRSLILLTKTTSKNPDDTALLRCLQACADYALDALRRLPPAADALPDVSVILFGILRSSADFWECEKSTQLAQQLSERVDAVVLHTWRPRVLVAAVHAIAKACPSQANLPLVSDALSLLSYHETQLSPRDVATLLWCMSALRIAEAQPQMWASLCRRATLLFVRMNAVSRLTLSQALLLQHVCLCESQAELLRVLHEANRELECLMESEAYYGSPSSSFTGCGDLNGSDKHQRRVVHKRHAARFYAENNTHSSRHSAPSQLTAHLLQYTTHSLSDDALVRLLITLFASSNSATEERLLVLAHLTQRTSLSERLCVQVLYFAQQYTMTDGDGTAGNPAVATTPTHPTAPSAPFDEVAELVRRARQHVTQLLVCAAASGPPRAPRELLEALCMEHHYMQRNTRATKSKKNSINGIGGGSTSAPRSKEALSSGDVWGTILTVLDRVFGKGSTLLHSLAGPELWSWHCIRTYVKAVRDVSVASTNSSGTSLMWRKDNVQFLERLDIHSDVQRCWPNNRKRLEQCAELVIASTTSSGTALLSCVDAARRTDALQLLETCVQEIHNNAHVLPVATTLRLLSATDAAPPIVSPAVHIMQRLLLAQLEAHASLTAEALPEMIRYLSDTLGRDNSSLRLGILGNNGKSSAGASFARLRVSDAVLDAYIRLLVQEQQRTLSTVQVQLLVQCLQERQRQPAALERAFMMLMTRRLGQSTALLHTITLPLEAMCDLIELTKDLPRECGDATATVTRTLTVTTLLDLLVQRSIPACTSADGLVAAGMLLRLDVVAEFHRVQELADALDTRGTELLVSAGREASWTPVQKAYIIAALVCAQREPSEALLRALHEDDFASSGTPATEEEVKKNIG